MEKWIRVAVADDNSLFAETVSRMASETFEKQNIRMNADIYPTGTQLLSKADSVTYDLIFLDIDMPGMDGITTARNLRKNNVSAEIAFVSSHEERVFDCFGLDILGFVRKGNFADDFQVIAKCFMKKHFNDSKVISFPIGPTDTTTLYASDILYVESVRYTKIIHFINGRKDMTARVGMELLEKLFSDTNIHAIHKSFLVNFDHVQNISRKELTLTDGTVLPIGRIYAEQAQEFCFKSFFRDSNEE